jgi:xanthine dehydrogenase accessory factor
MRDLLDDLARLSATGEPVGRAVVVSVWGSAPRRPGATMLATPSGRLAGSVSGGCVESATALEIASVIESGIPKVMEFGITDDTAWGVGLSCGGELRVLVEPSVRPDVVEAVRNHTGVVVATIIGGVTVIGTSMVVTADSRGPWMPPLDPAVTAAADGVADEVERHARARLGSGASTVETVTAPDGTVFEIFFEVHAAQPQLVVFGGVHIAEVLVPMAQRLGFRTVVADGREAFLTRDRFPTADRLILGWPDDVFQQVQLTPSTYVCVLTHDPKFDDPAVTIALHSDAASVGVIGSRRTQSERRERLRRAGLSDELIDRLHGPIGLDLGGREPGELALAILAQVVQVRHGTVGVP